MILPVIRALTYHFPDQVQTENLNEVEDKILRLRDLMDDLGISAWTLRVTLASLGSAKGRLSLAPRLGELTERLGILMAAFPLNSTEGLEEVIKAISDHPNLYASALVRGRGDAERYSRILMKLADLDPLTFTRVGLITLRRLTTPYFPTGSSEDDEGIIWAANYPNSHVTSFDPRTRKLVNYGQLNKESWPQYPRASGGPLRVGLYRHRQYPQSHRGSRSEDSQGRPDRQER